MTDSPPADTAATVGSQPTLPTIDLPSLLKPLTDIAASYGTGDLTGVSNPTQLLSQMGSALRTATRVGAGALGELAASWQGRGAQAATSKMQQAQQDNTAIHDQGQEQLSIANQAAQVVSEGRTQINAITTALQRQLAQLAPSSGTAAGQSAVIAATNNANSQAAQVVSQTQSQLGVLTSQMRAVGQPVPVISAPTEVSANISPQQGQSGSGTQDSERRSGTRKDSGEQSPGSEHGAGSGIGSFGTAGGLIGDIAMAPLGPWASTRFASWKPPEDEENQKNSQKGASAPVGPVSLADDPDNGDGAGAPPAAPGFMPPMGGVGMAATAGGAGDYVGPQSALRGNLLSARHVDEVVGDVEPGSFEVVGGTEPVKVDEEWDFSL